MEDDDIDNPWVVAETYTVDGLELVYEDWWHTTWTRRDLGLLYKTVYAHDSKLNLAGLAEEGHEAHERRVGALTTYSREIITMLELGNAAGRGPLVAVDGVSCTNPGDGSWTRKGGPGVPSMSYLDEYLESKKLTDDETLYLMLGSASALATLHHSGVVHLEVKTREFVVDSSVSPPSVMIQDFNNAIWLDYAIDGTACPVLPGDHPERGGNLRSPEEYNGLHLTAQADIFSLGYVLYEVRGASCLNRCSLASTVKSSEVKSVWNEVLTSYTLFFYIHSNPSLVHQLLTGSKPYREAEFVGYKLDDRDGGNNINIREAVALGANYAGFAAERFAKMKPWQKEVAQIVQDCWEFDPEKRPRASEVVKRIEEIRARLGVNRT